ncbi:hypothetical protein OH77DRAFT_960124 [Trametes cingulata]|nr:hypothetical protein OH77DRAFT_960124 [Trametes cingulata]
MSPQLRKQQYIHTPTPGADDHRAADMQLRSSGTALPHKAKPTVHVGSRQEEIVHAPVLKRYGVHSDRQPGSRLRRMRGSERGLHRLREPRHGQARAVCMQSRWSGLQRRCMQIVASAPRVRPSFAGSGIVCARHEDHVPHVCSPLAHDGSRRHSSITSAGGGRNQCFLPARYFLDWTVKQRRRPTTMFLHLLSCRAEMGVEERVRAAHGTPIGPHSEIDAGHPCFGSARS